MTTLQTIWTIIFAIAVLLFLVVEIVVVIGGARDLVHMMKVLVRAGRDYKE
ncbi:MAG: hypothetical protein JSW07_15065 [bacterium]|nr:MAG: hypothetical protein JSW07_15065 [bacterium]